MPEAFRIPTEFYPSSLPGLLWKGTGSGGVELYEFFYYNCPHCKKAAREIDDLISVNPGVKLALVNSPTVGRIGSGRESPAGDSPTVRSVRRLHIPSANARQAWSSRWRVALAIARDMALDLAKVEATADSATVTGVLRRQVELAARLGVSVTPSFAISGFGFPGWPGKKALQTMISNVRRCERPRCDDEQ